MSFVSYSEDIQKRHESDVHDLMRELELGHISRAQQTHVVPQLAELVRSLRDILLDPKSPAAIRLIEMRQQERRLSVENEILKSKNEKLAAKNTELNDRARRSTKETDLVRADLETSRRERRAMENGLSDLEGEVHRRDSMIADLRAQVTTLERLAMEAQIDHRV